MIIICNLKMYMNKEMVDNYEIDRDLIICPSSIHIQKFLDKGFKVGIQNVSEFENGSYTGQISANQAKEMGIDYVLIGHKEVNDSLDSINKKINISLKNNLKVILCLSKENKEELKQEIMQSLDSVDSIEDIIFVYEPIWCIDTGVTPTNETIETTIQIIQTIIYDKYHSYGKVLYGGSVDETTIKTLKNINNVSGFLIGKASANCHKLKNIINNLK